MFVVTIGFFLAPAAVLVPARVAEFLNLDDSVVHPVVRSSTALNGITNLKQPTTRDYSNFIIILLNFFC